LFFAVVRFSPPSQETEAVKRKAKAKNNSTDSQEPTFNLLVAAKGEARGRAKTSVSSVTDSGRYRNGVCVNLRLIRVFLIISQGK